MRKVSNIIAVAFKMRKPARLANTHTDGNAFFLHGNKIAEWRANELWISSAGWNTSTTRERLNAILWLIAPTWRVFQLGRRLHLQESHKKTAWDGGWIKVL